MVMQAARPIPEMRGYTLVASPIAGIRCADCGVHMSPRSESTLRNMRRHHRELHSTTHETEQP